MFCFGLQSIRASSTRTRPTSTHIGWRVKENFPETFKSQWKKLLPDPGSQPVNNVYTYIN